MVTKAATKSPPQATWAALADPTRGAIVRLLAERQCSVSEIADQLPVSRPAVSKHLRLLQEAGLVSYRSEGTRNLYSLEPAAIEASRDELDSLWRHALARYALVARNVDPARIRKPKAASKKAR